MSEVPLQGDVRKAIEVNHKALEQLKAIQVQPERLRILSDRLKIQTVGLRIQSEGLRMDHGSLRALWPESGSDCLTRAIGHLRRPLRDRTSQGDPGARIRAKREQLNTFYGLLPGRQGQNLACLSYMCHVRSPPLHRRSALVEASGFRV